MKDKFLIKTIDKEIVEVEGKKMKSKPKPKAPKWFSDYMSEFNGSFNKRFDKIDKRLENIETKLEKIENTPTMKKELKT